MWTRLSVVVALPLALSAPALSGGKGDAERLQGSWKLVSGENEGKPLPPEQLKGSLMVVEGDKIIANDPKNKVLYVLKFKLDPSRKPSAIDMIILEGRDKGKKAEGIYSLEGDTLKFCYAVEGKRPTDFKTADGDKSLSFVLQRVETKKK